MPLSKLTNAERAVLGLSIALALIFLATATVFSTSYDNNYIADSLYLIDLGRRTMAGLVPGVDYQNFYGGVTEGLLAIAFKLGGVSVKSIDIALCLMFGIVLLGFVAINHHRVRLTTGALLMLVCAATIFGRGAPEDRLVPRDDFTHAYIYNHFSISIMVVLAVFALLPSPNRKKDLLAACGAGILAYVLIFTKPIFVAYLPFLLVSVALLHRRSVTGTLVFVFFLQFMLWDPSFARFLSTLSYELKITAVQSKGLAEVFLKSIEIVFNGRYLVLAGIISLILLPIRKVTGGWLFAAAGLSLCVGYVACAATMAWFPNGQILPFAVVIPLVSIEALKAKEPCGKEPDFSFWTIFPPAAVMFYVIPVAISSIYVTGMALGLKDTSLIEGGPLTGYVYDGRMLRAEMARYGTKNEITRNGIELAKAYFLAGGSRYEEKDGVFFVFLDGLAVLRDIPDIESRRLISPDQSFNFPAVLQTQVVRDFPVWVGEATIKALEPGKWGKDVDTVALLRTPFAKALEIDQMPIIKMMAEDFAPCRSSVFWVLFVRKSPGVETCQGF